MTETYRQRRGRELLFALVAVLLCVSLPACVEDKDACGDDMEVAEVDFFGKVCIRKEVDTDTGPPNDTTPDNPDAGDDDASSTIESDIPTGMGDPCDRSEDCTGEADYCNLPPGFPGECEDKNEISAFRVCC